MSNNNEMYDRITGAGNASQELPGCVAKHSSIAYREMGERLEYQTRQTIPVGRHHVMKSSNEETGRGVIGRE